MAPDGSGLEQVNCVMNNNPPFIETFFVPWTQPAEGRVLPCRTA